MRLQKVYHRFSLLTTLPSSSTHHYYHRLSPLSPPSFLSLRPSKLSPIRHLRTQSLFSGKPFKISPKMGSRIHNLVPVQAVAGENAAANGTSNGSVSNTQYEDDLAMSSGYQLPPPELRDIVDAPPVPALSLSPHRDKMLFLKRRSLPPLADLARPEEKLAGVRIDGKCYTRSRMSFYTGIGIHQLRSDGTLGPEKEVI